MASGIQVGEAFIEVTADTSRTFNGLDSHASAAGGKAGGLFSGAFGKGIAGMGAALAGVFALDQITGFVGGVITGASNLNEEISKSKVIFGGASTGIESWAKGAATSVGLSESAALKATGTFGNMFTQLGYGGDEAANLSKDVVGLSADLGSFNNLPTATVADMMSSAFRGEYDSIQALLPGITAATVEQKALATTGKTSADQLTAQEKAAATLALAHEGGANAAGDFARTQEGMAGQTKIAEANFKNMSDSIGGVLLPIANNFMSFVNTDLIPGLTNIGSFIGTNVIPALQNFANGFVQAMPVIGTIAGVILAVLLPALITSGIQMAITAAAHVVGWITMAAGAVANAATVVGAWVLMGIQSMINAARMAAAWLIAMGPVGLVIALVVGLVSIIIANWDTIVNFTTQAFTNVSNFLVSIWGSIVSFLSGAWNNIVNFISTGVNQAQSIITSVFSAISGFIGSIFSTIVSTISNAFSNAVNFVNSAVNNIRNFIQSGFQAAVSIVSSVLSNIVSTISSGFSNAVSFVSNGVNNIRNFISSGFNAAIGIVSGAFGGIVGAISGGIGNAVNLVAGLPGRVMGALGNMGNMLVGSGQALIQGFISGIQGMIGQVTGAVGGLVQAARNLFPFSPAKEGPFSGRGYTTYSGEALGTDFAKSIKAQAGIVRAATNTLMGTASDELSGGLNLSASVNRSASGSTLSNGGNSIHIGQVVIDAKNIKDFNDVVEVFNGVRQAAVMGGNTQLRKA